MTDWLATCRAAVEDVRTVLAELPAAGGRRLLGVLRDGDGAARVRVGQAVRGEIDPAPDPGGRPVLRWRLA